MSDEKAKFVAPRTVTPLGGDFYMVNHITEGMCNTLFDMMDDNQRDELKAIYGDSDEAARAGVVRLGERVVPEFGRLFA